MLLSSPSCHGFAAPPAPFWLLRWHNGESLEDRSTALTLVLFCNLTLPAIKPLYHGMGTKHSLCPTHNPARDSYNTSGWFIMVILKSQLNISSEFDRTGNYEERIKFVPHINFYLSSETQIQLIIQPVLHQQLGASTACREPHHGWGMTWGPQAGKLCSKMRSKQHDPQDQAIAPMQHSHLQKRLHVCCFQTWTQKQ